MATDVEIASLALTRIGHKSISSFSASGDVAQRYFYANYEIIKKALLSEHAWNFAIKRASLSSTTAPTNEYSNAYTLPSDFIRLVRLNGDSKAGYRVERGTLATYEASAVIEYVYDVTDEATFTASFTDLLAQRLAAEVCFYLTQNTALSEMSWKIFQDKFAKAKSVDSREAAPRYRSANIALARLGETTRSNEDGANTLENAARLIEANYDTVRKALLREHTWGFAVKRVALSGTTAPVNDYSNRYTLPADFIRMVRLNASNEVTYRIEGAFLVTDSATATIEYIYNVTDEDTFSPDFLDILAQRLAAEAAAAINPQSSQGFWSIYQAKLMQAKATDSREAAPRKKAANLALFKLGEAGGRQGEDAVIARENAARIVEGLWDSSRKALLREHPWGFASKFATLVSAGQDIYTLPSDFIRAVRLNATDDSDYRIVGAQLRSTQASASLEYVYDLTDESLFDAQFTDLLAQRIAAEAAASINPGAASAMWTVYQQKLAAAMDADTREQAARTTAIMLAFTRLGDVSGKTTTADLYFTKKRAIHRILDELYDHARKSLLREHTWNFAIRRAILTRDTIRTITGATAANPVVITSASHGFANGATVYIDSIVGMTELNGRTFTVANQATNTFQLSGENGLAYTAYSSGGYAYPYIAKEYRYRYALPASCMRLVRINRTEADEYRVEGGYIYTDETAVDVEYVIDVTDEDDFDPQFMDVFAQRLAAEAAASINPAASGAMWNIYENKLRMARTMNSREGTPRGLDADTWMDARA